MSRISSLQNSINTLSNANLPDHLKPVALDMAWYLEAWKEIDERNGTESTPELVLSAVEEIRQFHRHIDKREAIDKLEDAYAAAYPDRRSEASDYSRCEVHSATQKADRAEM